MEAKLDWEFFAIVVQRDDPALIEREGLWQNGGRLHLRDRAKEHVQVRVHLRSLAFRDFNQVQVWRNVFPQSVQLYMAYAAPPEA